MKDAHTLILIHPSVFILTSLQRWDQDSDGFLTREDILPMFTHIAPKGTSPEELEVSSDAFWGLMLEMDSGAGCEKAGPEVASKAVPEGSSSAPAAAPLAMRRSSSMGRAEGGGQRMSASGPAPEPKGHRIIIGYRVG